MLCCAILYQFRYSVIRSVLAFMFIVLFVKQQCLEQCFEKILFTLYAFLVARKPLQLYDCYENNGAEFPKLSSDLAGPSHSPTRVTQRKAPLLPPSMLAGSTRQSQSRAEWVSQRSAAW